MKKICTLLLTAGMLFGAATGASAIDFKAKGQWIFGMGMVDTARPEVTLGRVGNLSGASGEADTFQAQQRVRLQIDAVASEALSATVFFEIGDQKWGNQKNGGALGTDGTVVEVKRAYIDWFVPNTDLSFRMGLQGAAFPNVAGGAAILDDDVAGIVANYKINDMASITLAWFRPYNDNYGNEYGDLIDALNSYNKGLPPRIVYNLVDDSEHGRNNFLDNIDMFLLSASFQGDNWSVNPWFSIGFIGDNVAEGFVQSEFAGSSSSLVTGISPLFGGQYTAALSSLYNSADNVDGEFWNADEDAYATMWFLGLPMTFQYDAWNFELDINYGYVQSTGTYWATNFKNFGSGYFNFQGISGNYIGDISATAASDLGLIDRVDNGRRGWLIKGLVEYKMDWGTPGLFAWYGSGDDDDVQNGSEMMPFLSPSGNFTSFLGDGELGWQPGSAYDQQLSYSGTWGIGLQVKDLSFVEDLTHIIRIAYWAGTNDSAMTDYIESPYLSDGQGFYLTDDDYLVEINFDTEYQIYENLSAHVQLGYIFNGIDHDNYRTAAGVSRIGDARDGYKATLTFNYSF